jgi:hypothetical protein
VSPPQWDYSSPQIPMPFSNHESMPKRKGMIDIDNQHLESSFFKERRRSVFFPSTKDALPSLVSHEFGRTTKAKATSEPVLVET